MKVKAFEIRDKGTFIPAIGILMEPNWIAEKLLPPELANIRDIERWLLRRAGFSCEWQAGWPRDVILCRMEAAGTNRNATYDCYAWGDRTFKTAHHYICHHWDDLQSGSVIDVEFINHETDKPKVSERETT